MLVSLWMSDNQTELAQAHETAWIKLMRVSQRILQSVEDDLKARHLPSLSWYDLLLELERAGDKGLRPYELQSAMLIRQYNMSRLLRRIEDEALIERSVCETDGRGQIVKITQQGKSLRKQMWPVYKSALEREVVAKMTAREAEELAQLLGSMGSTKVSSK